MRGQARRRRARSGYDRGPRSPTRCAKYKFPIARAELVAKQDLLDDGELAYFEHFLHYSPSDTPDEPQYHYTTWPALQSIMRKRELWAFDVRGLVDALEVEHGFQEVERLLKLRRGRLFELVLDKLREKKTARPLHVACFSREADDAAQWDRYADRGAGYCIRFDAAKLMAVIDDALSPYGVSVRYATRDEDLLSLVRRIDSFLDSRKADIATLTDAEEVAVAGKIVSWLGTDVLRTCAALKSPGYRSEEEWRVLLMGDTIVEEFPHGPREVVKIRWNEEDCPITAIWAGPRTPLDTVRGLERWLADLKYNAWSDETFDRLMAEAEDEHARHDIERAFEEAIHVRRSDLRWR